MNTWTVCPKFLVFIADKSMICNMCAMLRYSLTIRSSCQHLCFLECLLGFPPVFRHVYQNKIFVTRKCFIKLKINKSISHILNNKYVIINKMLLIWYASTKPTKTLPFVSIFLGISCCKWHWFSSMIVAFFVVVANLGVPNV